MVNFHVSEISETSKRLLARSLLGPFQTFHAPNRGVLSFEMRARPATDAGFRSKKGFEPVDRGDLARDRFDGDRQVVLALLAAGIGELMLDGSDLVVLIRR